MQPQNSHSNIVLIGFSGTGKSAVAREVAKQLEWDFVDTDDEIVRLCGKSISDIFKQDGEERFRQMELGVVARTCRRRQIVIATGGGAISDPRNQALLLDTGVVVCLEASAETIYRRLLEGAMCSSSPEVRPLLEGNNPLERIKQLKSSRQHFYAMADWTVQTDNLNLEEVSREVIRGWRQVSSSRSDEDSIEADLACDVHTSAGYYPVYAGWGILEGLGKKMRRWGLSGTAVIISDETVFSHYGGRVRGVLEEAGFLVNYCVVPPGESSKNIDQAVSAYDFLVEHRIERDDTIVALGGGMVGDLAGFVAATYLRGLPWLQVPTTLVAMSDASIGGKVGVDHPRGKNLIGSFYQPRLVLADVQTLTTLPQRELTSGWSEVIKHGLILDAGFFGLLEGNAGGLLRLSEEITTKVISRSACIKAEVVAEDEKETGKRILLNYGHTIAHGLEKASGYRLLHGEAVAVGMIGAARLSRRLGLLSEDGVRRQEALLRKFGLPAACAGVAVADALAAMDLDKKVRGKAIRWVLLEEIGRAIVRSDVPRQDVLEVLNEVIVP